MSEINLFITGDFCPIFRLSTLAGNTDINAVLGPLAANIKRADLSITNLECPITSSNTTAIKTGPSVKGAPASLDFLLHAGFNLVTLANNHIMDFGEIGLAETLQVLGEKSLPFIGAGADMTAAARPYFFQKEGITVGIINAAESEWSTTTGNHPGANPIDAVHMFNCIAAAKKQADVVIVIAHGGHEMYDLPSPRMKQLFCACIDMGADAVINHHTHIVSGYEVYRGKPIFYSLGNFLFDYPSEKSAAFRIGAAVQLTISKHGISFEQYYFRQCDEQPVITALSKTELNELQQQVATINTVINHAGKLEEAFDNYCRQKARMYTAFLEPRSGKFLTALQSRGLLPSFWSRRKKLYLENLVRCEAHRDVVLNVLKHANRHS